MRLSGLKNLLTETNYRKVEKLDSIYKCFGISICGYVIKKISQNNYSVRSENR